MKHLEIHSGDTTLASILEEVTATQREIVITQKGLPIARIVPCVKQSSVKQNYPLRGMPVIISEDFDEPMPELWDALSE